MAGHHALALFAALILGSASAAAQTPPPQAAAATVVKPLWKELTRPQQVALEPLAAEWDQLEAMRKQKWLDIANRYATMKPDEQARVQERMREWIKMTPEERRLVRENYTLSKKIGKGSKSEKWEQYQQLPEEEKRKLAAEAAIKKQKVTNLPPKPPGKADAPMKPPNLTPAACPAGQAKNAAGALPACVPAVPNAK